MDFPGSLTVDGDTLRRTLTGYCTSLARHGFERIVMIPSHGGNFATVHEAAAAAPAGAVRVVTFTEWAALRTAFAEILAEDGMALDAPGLKRR